jgi:phosphopentomutase
MKPLITDDDIQNAVDFLQNAAEQAAEAKANRFYMIEYKKVVKANMMQMHLDKPLAAQEREAYRSQEYINQIKAATEAMEKDALFEWKRSASEIVIEAWRTYNANKRGEGKLQ